MGSLFRPKIPAPPPIPDPPEPDFSYEDEARKKQAEEDEKRRNLNRKGRRSTILTGTGLADIADERFKQKNFIRRITMGSRAIVEIHNNAMLDLRIYQNLDQLSKRIKKKLIQLLERGKLILKNQKQLTTPLVAKFYLVH